MIIKYSHHFILPVVLLLSMQVAAQSSQVKAPVFRSFNSVQVLMGKTSNSFSVHSVNGLQINKTFTGIGLGFDHYYHTSVPFFLELRHNITSGDRKIQAFVNGGLHIPFGNTNRIDPAKTGDFKPGRLMAAGLDYYVPFKKDALILGIAYSQKKVTQMVDNNIWNPSINRVENVAIKEVYEFNRIWMRIGYVF
jgi:hypothetical protein